MMEKYRSTIKNRILGATIYVIVIVAFIVLNRVFKLDVTGGGFEGGFIDGVVSGVGALVIFFLFKYKRALKDDELLQKLYIEEHDEREIYLKYRVGHTGYMFSLIGLSLGMIISVYLNRTVFITLLVVTLIMSFMSIFLKYHYSRDVK